MPAGKNHELVDPLIAATALIASLAFLGHGFGGSHPGSELDLTSGLLAALSAVPLVGLRRAPLAVFIITAAASTVSAAVGYSVVVPVGPVVALYGLAASRDAARTSSIKTGLAGAGFLIAYLAAGSFAQRTFPNQDLLHAGLALTAAWFAGERTRLLQERMAELRLRAQQVQADAARDRRLAVAEERARIARDLHDSAGHAINVIAVRAGAARLRHERGPERSLAALAAIEDVARQTASDIDRIVHALRDENRVASGPDVAPGLDSLDTLVAHHAQSGVAVVVRRKGEPRPLRAATDQAVYRILQEALTNAARHGAGAPEIELSYGDTELEAAVSNPVDYVDAGRPEGGHGLIGMRERAVLLGGTLEADQVDGVFRVRARIPYGA